MASFALLVCSRTQYRISSSLGFTLQLLLSVDAAVPLASFFAPSLGEGCRLSCLPPLAGALPPFIPADTGSSSSSGLVRSGGGATPASLACFSTTSRLARSARKRSMAMLWCTSWMKAATAGSSMHCRTYLLCAPLSPGNSHRLGMKQDPRTSTASKMVSSLCVTETVYGAPIPASTTSICAERYTTSWDMKLYRQICPMGFLMYSPSFMMKLSKARVSMRSTGVSDNTCSFHSPESYAEGVMPCAISMYPFLLGSIVKKGIRLITPVSDPPVSQSSSTSLMWESSSISICSRSSSSSVVNVRRHLPPKMTGADLLSTAAV
mmetsp:Transcript_116903/g.203454  ORF Transcript_116903/g.203454 Transcript_116903/m.203454 type:complete len:321 (+) Transcript_116903:723-1685(+)